MVAPPAERRSLPAALAAGFTADPARWLLKARSPLVKWRTGVDLLGWPRGDAAAAALWGRRHDDADLAAVLSARGGDGLWREGSRFYGRRFHLMLPRYRAALWQLPLLADLGLTLEEPAACDAAAAFFVRRAADGFFDLGPGEPSVFGNALAASALARLGAPPAELGGVRRWLAGRQRRDGGWADRRELADEDAPSVVATTAEVVRALAGDGDAAVVAARAGGVRYLRDNLFTDYNGRFPPSAAPWTRLGWPQYHYDALSVATALAAAGASRADVAPLADAVRALETRRGFWRQQAVAGGDYWLAPVRAGRASRWVTFRAAFFLVWYFGALPENDCGATCYLL